jgi:hypothetical protein
MGQRIRFRGAYEPYLVGERPYDPRPVRPMRGPKRRRISRNEDPARTCSSCSRTIALGWPFYVTPTGTSRHDRCP